VLWSSCTVFAVFRFYYKTRVLRRKLNASDFFIVLTVLFELANRAVSTELLVKKLELSPTDVATNTSKYMDWNRQNLMFSWFQSIMWTIEVYSIKFSFLFGYFSLSPYLPRRFFRLLLFITIYCLAGGIITPTFIALLWCRPISDNWDHAARCSFLRERSIYVHATVEHIVSDALVIGFGLAMMRQLSCPRKEMLGAIVIASIGMASVGISIARAVLVWNERFSDDMLFCSVEISSGVMAACLPAFRAYLRSAWSPKKKGIPEEKSSPSGSTRGVPPGYFTQAHTDELESAEEAKPEFSAMVVREDINVELGLQKMKPTVSL